METGNRKPGDTCGRKLRRDKELQSPCVRCFCKPRRAKELRVRSAECGVQNDRHWSFVIGHLTKGREQPTAGNRERGTGNPPEAGRPVRGNERHWAFHGLRVGPPCGPAAPPVATIRRPVGAETAYAGRNAGRHSGAGRGILCARVLRIIAHASPLHESHHFLTCDHLPLPRTKGTTKITEAVNTMPTSHPQLTIF